MFGVSTASEVPRFRGEWILPLRQKDRQMLSRAGNWLIAVGAVAMFVAFCFLPAALGKQGDGNLLAVGACLLSLGALMAASGTYLKARAVQAKGAPGMSSQEAKNAGRRARGGCELCRGDVPVIHCKVHQLHLCAACLAEHYDFRSCAYVPSTRRPTTKAGKALAARART